MIGYRHRSSFDIALLKGAILEIEMPDAITLGKLGIFAGKVYPPEPWPLPSRNKVEVWG